MLSASAVPGRREKRFFRLNCCADCILTAAAPADGGDRARSTDEDAWDEPSSLARPNLSRDMPFLPRSLLEGIFGKPIGATGAFVISPGRADSAWPGIDSKRLPLDLGVSACEEASRGLARGVGISSDFC